ncbi:MAG: type II toxin-antitoxin system RelE/ParE family toxin [Nitrospirae bacterium]|nr:type II toxin-antitoxin system RelE/ParE family toxin [Nitrospirota bacterium]
MQNHKKVILLKSPYIWRFFDYVEGEGNPIDGWYQNLGEEARDFFDDLLKNLAKIENHLEWGIRGFLKGKYQSERIWELGFKAEDKQYRILGIFDGTKRAVMLMGCYHKQRVYTPANALDTAYQRAKNLSAKKATIHERKIKTDL